MDEKKVISDGKIERVFKAIYEIPTSKAECVRRSYVGARYVLYKDVAKLLNAESGKASEFRARFVSNAVQVLGMRKIRTGEGWGVVIEEEDLRTAKSRLMPLQAE